MSEQQSHPVYGRIVAIVIALTVLVALGMAFYVLFPR
jgi:hypothetical protein